MKIAVSGSACTGKTTLAKVLADNLGYVYLEEGFQELFQSGKKSPAGQVGQERRAGEVLAFMHTLNAKTVLVKKHQNCIVDRCPLDLMNLWLARGHGKGQRRTTQFYKSCREAVKDLDYIVMLPWGILPLEPQHDEEGKQVRNLNPWMLMHSHATILGLARMWLRRDQLIVVPDKLVNPESRTEYVLQRVKSLRSRH